MSSSHRRNVKAHLAIEELVKFVYPYESCRSSSIHSKAPDALIFMEVLLLLFVEDVLRLFCLLKSF